MAAFTARGQGGEIRHQDARMARLGRWELMADNASRATVIAHVLELDEGSPPSESVRLELTLGPILWHWSGARIDRLDKDVARLVVTGQPESPAEGGHDVP